ncbi:MAG: helix-turn-helix domain-containing protein [Candidatus Thorarchaeota archaeon]
MFARDEFLALPPSAKLVYVLLRHRKRMSRQELIAETFLPPRTVNYGISRLKRLGLIMEESHAEDRRIIIYTLNQV